jgi:hypothetical protein
MPEYPWYAKVSGSEIQQGDMFFDLEVPVISAGAETQPLSVELDTFDVIIMTQSCDIPKKRTRHLIMCPIWGLEEAGGVHSAFANDGGKENLRRGLVTAFHLLDRCDLEGFDRDFLVVQFERIIERPKDSILAAAAARDERLRLLPPYREHLAQSFARFFMRVGLPIDIPAFAR